MTEHDHSTYVEGCFRCELSRDEADNLTRSPADALCEMCGEAAYYVLSDEALDFCADCAVSLLSEQARALTVAANGARALIERHRATRGSSQLLTTALQELDDVLPTYTEASDA